MKLSKHDSLLVITDPQYLKLTCRQESEQELEALFVLERLSGDDLAEDVNAAVGDERRSTWNVKNVDFGISRTGSS